MKHVTEFLVPGHHYHLSEEDASGGQEELPGEAEISPDTCRKGNIYLGSELCISQSARAQEARNIKDRDKSKSNTMPCKPQHCSLYVETLV